MRPALRLVVVSLSLLVPNGDAFGDKPMVPGREALLPEAGDLQAPTSLLLATGFEASEGFVLGPVEPQLGWVATGINSPWASISTVHPAVGAQHLRLGLDSTAPWGSTRIALSPPAVLPSNTPSQFKALVYITNDLGADYDFVGQSLSEGLMTWRVKFSRAGVSGFGRGTIFIVDHIEAEIGFYSTGVLWTPGTYVELKVQHDPSTEEIRYFYGGALIYRSRIWGGTAVEQIAMSHDNRQLFEEYAGVDAI